MFRRKFLQSLGLVSLGTALPLSAAEAQHKAKAVDQPFNLNPITIKGSVHHNNKGLAGIPVTDGYNIVLTDKAGKYTLNTNATADFVYLTIPRGYDIPHEKGIAQFFKPIAPGTANQTADFALQKLNKDDTNHNFVVWADPQMMDKKDTEQLVTESAPDLKNLVAQYPADTLFHAIGCGDLVWDKFELYDDYKKAVDITGIPFFQVIGNHDMDIKSRSDDHSSDTFKTLFGPTYYSFNRGEIHYIVLDNGFFSGMAKMYIGYLTEKYLQCL